MITLMFTYFRLSNNSRTDHAGFQHNVETNNEINKNSLKKDASRVHTPANISNAVVKPAAFAVTSNSEQQSNERMVSLLIIVKLNKKQVESQKLLVL